MSPHLPPSLLHLLRPSSPPECSSSANEKSNADRHFVSWTDQEDEILRQAVRLHGTDKWSMIASQFRNKTSRQCRRRWSTYLSTNCKKGGWSPEEDQVLLEAHRKFGNRWTEIAKVVAGRTDNAVKNRFCALSKKQAKDVDVSSSQSSGDLSTDDGTTNQKKNVLSENINILNKKNRNEAAKLVQLQEPGQHHISRKDAGQLQVKDKSFADRAHPLKREPLLEWETMNGKVPHGFHRDAENGKKVRRVGFSTVYENILENPLSNQGINAINIRDPHLENLSPRLHFPGAKLPETFVERQDARSRDQSKEISKAWFSIKGGGMSIQTHGMASFSLLPETSLEYAYDNMDKIPSKRLNCTSIPVHNVSVQSRNLASAQSGCSGDRQKKQSTPSGLEKIGMSDKNFEAFGGTKYEGIVNNSLKMEGIEEFPLSSSSITGAPSPTAFVPYFQFVADGMPSPQFSDSEKQFLLSALDVNYTDTSFMNCSNLSTCRASLADRFKGSYHIS